MQFSKNQKRQEDSKTSELGIKCPQQLVCSGQKPLLMMRQYDCTAATSRGVFWFYISFVLEISLRQDSWEIPWNFLDVQIFCWTFRYFNLHGCHGLSTRRTKSGRSRGPRLLVIGYEGSQDMIRPKVTMDIDIQRWPCPFSRTIIQSTSNALYALR